MVITSLENDKIKSLCKLQQKKYRDESNTFLVEGEHLVQEADIANSIEELIITEDFISNYNYPTITVTKEVMKKISNLDNPPIIMALCRKNNSNEIKGNKIVLLDEIQDPGNLGTIIRSSLAFNVDTIVLSNCVDLYNPKVLRGTQGMFYHINIVNKDTNSTIDYMKENNIPVYGTSVEGGLEVKTLTKQDKDKYCLIMGNEGKGLSKDILDKCDKKLYIKMNEKTESLNVGVACSIILYELGD